MALDPLQVYYQFSDHFDHYTIFLRFFHYLVRLRPHILLSQAAEGLPLKDLALPPPVTSFLCDRLQLTPALVRSVWTVLGPTIHEWVDIDYSKDVDDAFRAHGRTFQLGKLHVHPSVFFRML